MQSPNKIPSSEANRLSGWLSSIVSGKLAKQRGRAATIIGAIIVMIGILDYLSGTRVSLQFFYLIPTLLSVAWFGPVVGCVVAGICVMVWVAGDLLGGAHYEYPITFAWNQLIDFAIFYVLVWTFHAFITLYKTLEKRVQDRTEELQQALRARDELQHQLFDISRRERSAIGHDLHDGLGQHLTATAMAADMLATKLDKDHQASSADAKTVFRLVQEAIDKTRQIARGLLLAAVEPEELISELEELSEKVSKDSRVQCRFVMRGDGRTDWDSATASHLFYVAQEAVSNALRHGHAKEIEISLELGERAHVLTISDTGIGILPPEADRPGMGLKIMAHRAGLIGGHLTIAAGPEGGTEVCLVVPHKA